MQKHNFKTYPHINYCTQQRQLKIVEYNDFISNGPPLLTQPHKIDYYALIFITKGTLQHQLENSFIELHAGDVLFLCPGLLHAFIENQQVEGYIITFIEEFLTLKDNAELIYDNFALLHDFTNIRILKTSETVYQFVSQLYDLVWQEYNLGSEKLQSPILQSLVKTIFYYLKRVNYAQIKELDIEDKKYYALAIKYRALIRNQVNIQTTLQDFLDQLLVSQSTLQKSTKVIFNRTPKELIDENIIGAAKGMLADQFMRVNEISEILGFSEPTNFSKYFKKHTGYTPENYRVLY